MTIENLRKELRDLDCCYRHGEPLVSDLEYDRKLAELARLEKESGKPIPPDSPTQRVGGEPVGELPRVKHRVPMLSIGNTYNIGELQEFGNRVKKSLGGDTEWFVELKIDGVAASLIYEDGILVRVLTRGDGNEGDDVTHNVRTMRDVPLRLDTQTTPKTLEVRGEVYMLNSDLTELLDKGIIKEKRDENDKPLPMNTRNVTAGTIRLLDPKICAERRLRFFAHSAGSLEGFSVKTHRDFLKELETFGIPVTPHAKYCTSFAEAAEYCESLYTADGGFLVDLDFEIDGLVLKVNDFSQREQLGATGHHPLWAIAYKVKRYEAKTTLREITVQVGKTGTITPVAELEPVEIAGTTVSRASLHNAEEIERKDIRVGDVVVVEKAGKIIPRVVRVEKHLRKRLLEPYVFPSVCPECGEPVSKDEDGVYIRCNNHQCPAQFKEKLRFFAGRNAMDIEGLGKELIDQLVDSGLVRSFGDLYRLTWETIREKNLERMKAKPKKPDEIPLLVKNLLDGIEASKSRELPKLLNALSIRHVGQRTANILAEKFGTLDTLRTATITELSETDEVGPIIAENVFEYFRSENGARTIDDLLSLGLLSGQSTPQRQSVTVSQPLTGQTIVVTGTLQHFKRDEIESVIAKHGGRPASSVSSKTSFVLVGSNPGGKLAKAEKLGVRIVLEPEFREMILSFPLPPGEG